jgi:hypothetical protein
LIRGRANEGFLYEGNYLGAWRRWGSQWLNPQQLHQKLEIDPSQPKLLLSESGVGYRLQEQGAELVKKATGLK